MPFCLSKCRLDDCGEVCLNLPLRYCFTGLLFTQSPIFSFSSNAATTIWLFGVFSPLLLVHWVHNCGAALAGINAALLLREKDEA